MSGLGNRKNDYFAKVLADEGVEAYPGSVQLLDALRARGMAMAIVSSSRNAPAVLAAAGMTDYFQTVMHGGVAAERHLAGKPAPDTFLAAAEDLGATAARAVVLEDAISGVAGRRGGRLRTGDRRRPGCGPRRVDPGGRRRGGRRPCRARPRGRQDEAQQ